MSAEEEARAAAYRASLKTRRSFRRGLRSRLAGDAAAARNVRAAWAPIIDAIHERRSSS